MRSNSAPLLLFVGILTLLGSAAGQTKPPYFLDATTRNLPGNLDGTAALILGDVDGDGDLDCIVGNGLFAAKQNLLLLGDDKGVFKDATATNLPAQNDTTSSLALADVDGDGDLDLIIGNVGEQNLLYLNDGKGLFTDATAGNLPAFKDPTRSLSLNDFDGDGNLDILVINDQDQNRLYLGDGKGKFTDATAGNLPVAKDAAWAHVVGDLDGDGDLDFIIGKWGPGADGQNRLYLGDGKGKFTDATASNMPVFSDRTYCLVLGDFDGDKDLDVIVGNGGQNGLLLNDGKGLFTDATIGHLPTDLDCAGALLTSDFDGDGHLDLLVGNFNLVGGRNRLLLNDGKSYFSDVTGHGLPTEYDSTYAMALGDVDQDGDQDVLFGNYQATGQQNKLFVSITQQIYTAKPPQIGTTYNIDCYSRPAGPGLSLICVPMISMSEGSLPFPPIGTFRLGLSSLIIFPPKTTSITTAKATTPIPLVLNTSLVGVTFYLQALVQASAGLPLTFRFTNLIADTVIK